MKRVSVRKKNYAYVLVKIKDFFINNKKSIVKI